MPDAPRPALHEDGTLVERALDTLWQTTLLFAPLLFAGAVAAVVLRFDLLACARRPIDCGATLRGVRLFGDNKTWRGLLVAVLAAALGAELQARLPAGLAARSLIEPGAPAFVVGALMGLGAILGELPNSFLKRRLGIAPGRTTKGPLAAVFYVLDQVDLLLGAWPLIAPFVRATLGHVVASFVVALAIHPTMSVIGWALGVRRTAR